MSRLQRARMQAKLSNILGIADDEQFITLIWAVNALQSGREERVKSFIKYPRDAITQDMGSALYVHPWRLETLVNELLVTSKPRPAREK